MTNKGIQLEQPRLNSNPQVLGLDPVDVIGDDRKSILSSALHRYAIVCDVSPVSQNNNYIMVCYQEMNKLNP